MRIHPLIGALLVVASAPAHADGDPVSESVPMSHASGAPLELRLGLAFGGPVGLLAPVDGVKRLTTEKATGVLYARLRLPRISSRVLELYGVFPNGIGANLKNDDFRLGNFRFSLVDAGIFWNAHRPVSVRRVERRFDLTVGTSVEYRMGKSWNVGLDWRVFLPADIFDILTDYGDFARLIGREAVQGGQLWLGLSRSW